MTKINSNGDSLVPTSVGRGSDISSQREDALESMALDWMRALLQEKLRPNALDLGCGLGAVSLKLSKLGIHSDAVDLLPPSELCSDAISKNLITWHEKSASDFLKDSNKSWTLIIAQRFLHYLPWKDAQLLLSELSKKAAPKAKIILTVSGLNSELGDNYLHKAWPVQDRFCPLSDEMQEKHGINQAVCLYTAAEAVSLLTQSQWKAIHFGVSDFGNIKIIATNE